MPNFTDDFGSKLRGVHEADSCRSEFCTIHNPSMPWNRHWRDDLGFMEYICPCGVGYPAPEDMKGVGHAFGTCGNEDCLSQYRQACEKVKLSKEKNNGR